MARAEAERDVAYHEASMARMDADAAGSARAKVESELARVQNALTVSVTSRPDEVHSTCNCKGAYVHQVPL